MGSLMDLTSLMSNVAQVYENGDYTEEARKTFSKEKREKERVTLLTDLR